MKTVLGLSLVGLGLENKQQETKVKQREKEFCLREREALWIEKKKPASPGQQPQGGEHPEGRHTLPRR